MLKNQTKKIYQPSELISNIMKSLTEEYNIKNRDIGKKFLNEDFQHVTKNPEEASRKLLFKVLKDNKDTEYGRKYNFEDISSVEDYQKTVPVITYDDIAEYVERMKSGEENVLISSKFRHMNLTSGTTGNPKLIPLTDEQAKVFMKYQARYMAGIIDRDLDSSWVRGKVFFILEGKHTTLDTGVTVGSASSFMADAIKGDIEPFSSQLKAMYTSPGEAMVPGPDIDTKYIHLRFALMDGNIAGISAPLYSNLVIFMNYLHRNYGMLIDDIERGTIDSRITLPDDVRQSLLEKIDPMPERAKELRKIFKNGPDIQFMPLIWPKLQYIVGIGTGDLSVYDEMLKKRFHGGKIHHIYTGIASSEGLWSVPAGVDDVNSILVPDGSFMEFLDVEFGDDFSKCVTIGQLEEGRIYELIVTTLGGLYRYRLSDAVKVTGFYNDTPMVEFMFRVNKTINVAGEKTTESMLERVAEDTLDEFDLSLRDYEICTDFSQVPGKYVVMIESDDEKRFSISREELSKVYMEKLCEVNPEFKRMYGLNYVGEPEVYFEKPGAQIMFKEKMDAQSISDSQFKPVHIIRTGEQKEFFLGLREL